MDVPAAFAQMLPVVRESSGIQVSHLSVFHDVT